MDEKIYSTMETIQTERDNGSRKVGLVFEGPGRTHQEFREDSDINVIVRRWKSTGMPPVVTLHRPLYGDFTGSTDYQEQLDQVMAAQERFMELPAEVRAAVDNDPAAFLAAMETPEGRSYLAASGLQIGEADPNENDAPGVPGEPLAGASPDTPKEPPASETGSQSPEN